MKTATLFFLILLVTAAGLFAGRNAKFDNLADRTWINVCPFGGHPTSDGGSAEVPWAYDAKNRILVRVGGCTNVYNNAVVFFDLGDESWEIAWPYDPSAPTDRPGCGCNRGLCYDPNTECVYTVGGATSGCGGKYGLWQGDMGARTWASLTDRQGQQGHVAVDPAAQKVVITYWDIGSYQHCKIWDQKTGSLRAIPPKPGTTQTEWVYLNIDYWYALEYMPAMQGVMFVAHSKDGGWHTWFLDTENETWTDLNPSGLPSSYGRAILSYDPVAQVMLLMVRGQGLYVYNQSGNTWSKITTGNDPTGGWSEMFEYDGEHNVHVFTMLSGKNQVWAFRYANDPATRGRMVQGSVRFAPALSCSPNPFSASAHITLGPAFQGKDAGARIQVLSANGRVVEEVPGQRSFLWDAGDIAPGMYLVRAFSGNNVYSKKVMLIR